MQSRIYFVGEIYEVQPGVMHPAESGQKNLSRTGPARVEVSEVRVALIEALQAPAGK